MDVNTYFHEDSEYIIDPLTGFPIAELVKGAAIPTVTIDEILKCPFIWPRNHAPDPDKQTPVYYTMGIDRLLDIDHMNQTVSVFASFALHWVVWICPATLMGTHSYELERVFVADETKIWKPNVRFTNSSDDMYMISDRFGSQLQVLYVPTTTNRTLFFYWTRAGILTSKCKLQVKYFPYDLQVCDFYFQLSEPNDFLLFGGIYLKEIRLPKDNFWIYQGGKNETGLVRSSFIKEGIHSYAYITLRFRRNPYYYIYSLLAPCLILIFAVFVSFMMPPHRSERSLLCATLVLAFTMAQNTIIQEVPVTSEKMIFSEFILSIQGITAIVSLFDMLMLAIAKAKKRLRLVFKVDLFFVKLAVIRAIDLCAMLVVFLAFTIISLTTISHYSQ